MTEQIILLGGFLLTLKHFLVDGPLQTEYQYTHKGTWGHLGGVLHAFLHALGTILSFVLAFTFLDTGKPFWFLLSFSLLSGLFDGTIHYMLDLTKAKISRRYGWSGYHEVEVDGKTKKLYSIYSNKYFWALVADQSAHFFTYVCLLALAVNIIHETPLIQQ